ncbi:peptidoglycan endopeptidase [Moorella naiadis]|uniref:C40 family peptidase n=1 Tax=Moorella naiadis (nom. illeg.) TaxID=3093670 RepID=UPI003D9C86C2
MKKWSKYCLTATLAGAFTLVAAGVALAQPYEVQRGDTLWALSRRYGVTVEQIQAANNLDSSLILVGQTLEIPTGDNPPATSYEPTPASRSESVAPSTVGARIAAIARQYEGTPYRWGGTSPKGFDCSGFTLYVFDRVGIDLPHSASDQASLGTHVDKDELMPGDLVFFHTYARGISHVGIYVGDGNFISATNSGVSIDSINDPYYWGPRYVGARRVR